MIFILLISCTVPDDLSVQDTTTTQPQDTTTTTQSQDITTTTQSQDTTTTTQSQDTTTSLKGTATYDETACINRNKNDKNKFNTDYEITEEIKVIKADDVTQEIADRTLNFAYEAYSIWMEDPYYGKCQANNIILHIIGTDLNKSNSEEYCQYLKDQEFSSGEWCDDYVAEEYTKYGGASLSSNRSVEGFTYFPIGIKNPKPDTESWKTVIFHEMFHIYQKSNVFSNTWEEDDIKYGLLSGDNNEITPWYSEGHAEFIALLYSLDTKEFKNKMKERLLGDYGDGSGIPEREQYINDGVKLYNITYGEQGHLAYGMGAWFVAYLVSNEGEDTIYKFYETLNDDGFENAFMKIYGTDFRSYVDNFDEFIKQPIDEIVKILEGIKPLKISTQG